MTATFGSRRFGPMRCQVATSSIYISTKFQECHGHEKFFYQIYLLLSVFGLSHSDANGLRPEHHDDISATGFGNSFTPISNGYAGFDWNNFGALNTAGNFPASGYVNGTVSPNNVAYNSYGNPAAFSAVNPFILVSGYFASGTRNGMSLEITGINGITTVFDETFIVSATGPALLMFPNAAITEVDFVTSGGVDPVAGYLGGNPTLVLDNLTIAPVPEPSMRFLGAFGIGTLILLRQLKVRRRTQV